MTAVSETGAWDEWVAFFAERVAAQAASTTDEAVGFTGRPPKPEFWPVHTCLTATPSGRTDEAWGRP